MITPYGHLTYCSNIHPGEQWDDHFKALQENIPYIREQLAPGEPFALGLRIANEASIELSKPERLSEFKNWLREHNVYITVINGFPYGGFHGTHVKDQVHTPDWTTDDRLEYTKRLFTILAQILPENTEGGVSTPPLSYRLWWKTEEAKRSAVDLATRNILAVIDHLMTIEKESGKVMHLHIEPEPDGILDNTVDFVNWYRDDLLPAGILYLKDKYGFSDEKGKETILHYIRLCYDICHAAVAYEKPEEILERLDDIGIKVGRIQVSSALKVDFLKDAQRKFEAIQAFNETVYLHQVVAETAENGRKYYPDLPEALQDYKEGDHKEWRVHFHVPLFIDSYGLLNSTRSAILETLAIHIKTPFAPCLEVETYTWGVLPDDIQKPIGESIVREMEWVRGVLNNG